MKKVFSFLMLFMLWSLPLRAESAGLSDLFEAPCRELGIPKPLALAIAQVESGLHPWSLNIEGRSYRFGSKSEALAKAEEAWREGRSFDTGLMQVNNWWLKKFGVSLEAALDPLANVYFGGWILKEELARHGGDIKAAAGAYHSPNPERADRYARVVMAALEDGPRKRVAVSSPSKAAKAPSARPAKSRIVSPEPVENIAAPMLVASRHKGLAQAHSMKAASTAAVSSMKVKA